MTLALELVLLDTTNNDESVLFVDSHTVMDRKCARVKTPRNSGKRRVLVVVVVVVVVETMTGTLTLMDEPRLYSVDCMLHWASLLLLLMVSSSSSGSGNTAARMYACQRRRRRRRRNWKHKKSLP